MERALDLVDRSRQRSLLEFPLLRGNFDAAGQRDLLERIAVLCQPQGGGLLIGIDLVKDVATLETAYNDREGVTADFNLNLLERINRDLDADFDTSNFRHQAIFNPEKNRIEMYLISKCEQWVSIGASSCRIAKDEAICTEYSHKYSVEGFTSLAAGAGFTLDAYWTDEQKLFAVLLLRVKDRPPAS